jgi:cytochrome c peroxidase
VKPLLGTLAFTLIALACGNPEIPDTPAPQGDLDAQLRVQLGGAGVASIAPAPAQDPAQVALGQALMFDRVLSGNRDISCATCHHPSTHGADDLSLSIGTGGTGLGASRLPGAGRRLVPRNAPSLLNQGLRSHTIFWDGRIAGNASGPFTSPAKPALPGGITSILAAQAMFPVLSREEMRGDSGDHDVFGAVNELAQFADTLHGQIWQAVTQRLLAIPEYVTMFRAAFPNVAVSALGFQHAATAIAAFEMQSFNRFDTPFDRYLNRDNSALTTEQKQGGVLFFGKAGCASCHRGPLLGGETFANDGIPQIGPGTTFGAPLDWGVSALTRDTTRSGRFRFRIPALRNVELTAPYMHDGAYPTLEAVVEHYNDVMTSLRTFDPALLRSDLQSLYHGDNATMDAVAFSVDFRLRRPLGLSPDEKGQLVAFLKSLTDPAARDLSSLAPSKVPSGLPVD